MSSAIKIPTAIVLLTILLLGAMLVAATPQNAFAVKYWGDVQADEAHDDLKDDVRDDVQDR